MNVVEGTTTCEETSTLQGRNAQRMRSRVSTLQKLAGRLDTQGNFVRQDDRGAGIKE